MSTLRQQTVDRQGRPIVPGLKVKVLGEAGAPEGTVVRVLDDYKVLTVVIPEGRGQVERMYRVEDVEVA
jgi:hypothetical protein